MQVVITLEEKQQIESDYKIDPTAYGYNLQARELIWQYWRSGKMDTIALNKCEILIKNALMIDFGDARIWSSLGSIVMDQLGRKDDFYNENY